jgi:hypothetical protein
MLHFLLPLEFSALPLILFLANKAKPLPATQREENTKILLCWGEEPIQKLRTLLLIFLFLAFD